MQGVNVMVKLYCRCSAGIGALSQVQDITKTLHFKVDSHSRSQEISRLLEETHP